jgi:hypothetical protein
MKGIFWLMKGHISDLFEQTNGIFRQTKGILFWMACPGL